MDGKKLKGDGRGPWMEGEMEVGLDDDDDEGIAIYSQWTDKNRKRNRGNWAKEDKVHKHNNYVCKIQGTNRSDCN